ncbi:MAG TPA: hypothetical protein VJ112_00785 [Rhabdochlamydiaceae bacterium]|nr:hypothetical protein [Rhabdochlamydiaceae bacterium]
MITSEILSSVEQQEKLHFNRSLFEEQIDRHAETALCHFKQITRHFALFHFSFLAIAFFELFAFILFFSFLTKSTVLAFSLAAILLTGFSYFVLLFYLQAKKPEQLLHVRHNFLKSAQDALPLEKGTPEYHLSIAHALHLLATKLQNQEYTYYALPPSFQTLSPLMEKLSVWIHWQDLHQMKEILQLLIVREQVEMVKIQPADLQAHASLANAHLALSRLYCDPRKIYPEKSFVWISPEYSSPEMQQKFRKCAERAIEEFKILDQFAPNDPWVHAQLAGVFHELEMPFEEMQEYETVLKISPLDNDVLFRLGVLYFQQGLIAKGLRVYEQLKMTKEFKAAELISYYDAYLSEEYQETN